MGVGPDDSPSISSVQFGRNPTIGIRHHSKDESQTHEGMRKS